MQIEFRLMERSGTAVTNFALTMPKPDSDLARESLKDPYRVDFLELTEDAQEREIENALVKHVTDFFWSWARDLPSSGGRCCWMWAVRSFSSTCCFTT
jgi:predicted nuclease of restriction endonuclease-like (RecB) superfamily